MKNHFVEIAENCEVSGDKSELLQQFVESAERWATHYPWKIRARLMKKVGDPLERAGAPERVGGPEGRGGKGRGHQVKGRGKAAAGAG